MAILTCHAIIITGIGMEGIITSPSDVDVRNPAPVGAGNPPILLHTMSDMGVSYKFDT